MYKKINTAQYLYGFKLCLFLSINLISPLASAQMPSPQELLDQLGIIQQDISRLNQGEVVLFDVEISQETELTAGVIIYVLAPNIKALSITVPAVVPRILYVSKYGLVLGLLKLISYTSDPGLNTVLSITVSIPPMYLN